VTEAGRVRRAVAGLTLGWGVSALPDFCGLFGVSFDYGLLITVCSLPFMLIDYPGLANFPWYRLVLGFLVMFLESNLLCSSVFQFDYFILLILLCLILFVFFVFYSIISSKVQLVVRVGVLFLKERLQQ